MRKTLTAALCLITLSACASYKMGGPPVQAASPAPQSVAEWYKWKGKTDMQELTDLLDQLDAAVRLHNKDQVQAVLGSFDVFKQQAQHDTAAYPLTDTDTQTKLQGLLFDIDGLTDSFQSGVVNDDFAELSDAQNTEKSFKQSLTSFQSYVTSQIGGS